MGLAPEGGATPEERHVATCAPSNHGKSSIGPLHVGGLGAFGVHLRQLHRREGKRCSVWAEGLGGQATRKEQAWSDWRRRAGVSHNCKPENIFEPHQFFSIPAALARCARNHEILRCDWAATTLPTGDKDTSALFLGTLHSPGSSLHPLSFFGYPNPLMCPISADGLQLLRSRRRPGQWLHRLGAGHLVIVFQQSTKQCSLVISCSFKG